MADGGDTDVLEVLFDLLFDVMLDDLLVEDVLLVGTKTLRTIKLQNDILSDHVIWVDVEAALAECGLCCSLCTRQ